VAPDGPGTLASGRVASGPAETNVPEEKTLLAPEPEIRGLCEVGSSWNKFYSDIINGRYSLFVELNSIIFLL
jgi:hypothetical protein